MTVTTTTRNVVLQGNSSTTQWPFNFEISAVEDLQVRLTQFTTGVVTVVSPQDYTVFGLGNPSGGFVVYPLSGPPLTGDYFLEIVRDTRPIQLRSVSNQTRFFPGTAENAWDYLTLITQDIKGNVDRAFKAPFGYTGSLELPQGTDLAGKALIFNQVGDLSVADLDLQFDPNRFENYLAVYSGDGVEDTFSLPVTSAGKNNVSVHIDGVYQYKDAFEVSGTVLTFSAPPPKGTDNIEVVMLIPAQEASSDQDIVDAFTRVVPKVSSGEKQAGVLDAVRQFSPSDVKDMAVLFGGGGGGSNFISPLSFGAAGDGITQDRVAFQNMLNSISGSSKHFRTIDLGGRSYLIDGYLYMGRFDWDQDGTYDDDTGPINNLYFTNGTLIADPSGDWTSPWPNANDVWDTGVPSSMVYIGDIVNQSYVPYRGEDQFDVYNIYFSPTFIFKCGFVTGGAWVENAHRVEFNRCLFHDIGIDCAGVASPQSVGSPRGYTPINQETKVIGGRFEGNQRIDGISNWPGKEAFNDGAEIGLAQDVSAGALALNGAYTSGGEFVSPIGKALFVALQNVYDETLTDDYYDFRGVEFTITGFADVARTIPVTEVMKGPRGGRKINWEYSARKYAVITSITSNTTVPTSLRNKLLISTDYRNYGVRIGTHDAKINNNNMTALSYAAVISGRAGEFQDNHPWSRYVLFTDNSRKFTITGNYMDFTTVDLYGAEHLYIGNANKAGSPALHLYPNKVDDDGSGLVVSNNSFTQEAYTVLEDNVNGNNWQADKSLLKYVLDGITLPGGALYSFIPGFVDFSAGATFQKYLTVLAGGEFNGNLIMRNNRILSVGAPQVSSDATNREYVDAKFTSGTVTALFNGITSGGTSISGDTGYINGAAGAEFAGYVTFNGNVDLNNNRILAATSVTFPPQATEPAGSNGTFANSTGAASTNGFGTSGPGYYTKLNGTWTKVG